jgi:hypothetical protein
MKSKSRHDEENGGPTIHSVKISQDQYDWAQAEGARVGLGHGNLIREIIYKAMRSTQPQPAPQTPPWSNGTTTAKAPANKPVAFRDLPINEQAQIIIDSDWYDECEGMEDPEGVKDFLGYVVECDDIKQLTMGQKRLWLKTKSMFRQYGGE